MLCIDFIFCYLVICLRIIVQGGQEFIGQEDGLFFFRENVFDNSKILV